MKAISLHLSNALRGMIIHPLVYQACSMKKVALIIKERSGVIPVRYIKKATGNKAFKAGKKNHPYYPEVKMPKQPHGYIKSKRNDCL